MLLATTTSSWGPRKTRKTEPLRYTGVKVAVILNCVCLLREDYEAVGFNDSTVLRGAVVVQWHSPFEEGRHIIK